MPRESLSMIIYGLIDVRDSDVLREAGFEPGAVELLQQSGLPHLGDERSDRSRVMWPHVFDVLHGYDRGGSPGAQLEFARRWRLAGAYLAAYEHELGLEAGNLVGVEVLRFLGDLEVNALKGLPGGVRSEVVSGLAVLYVGAPVGRLRRFQSRATQWDHGDVQSVLAGIGHIARDRWGDAMHASELPFVVSAGVSAAPGPEPEQVADRDLDGAVQLDEYGWNVAVWQDLVVLSGATTTPVPYWPRHRATEVAIAGVGDVLLMRVAQRYALHMLASRVGQAAPGDALELQRAAHPMRSRLWWSGLSGDPLVAAVADAVAERWDLDDLADETFSGLEVVAQRDALEVAHAQAATAAQQAETALDQASEAQELARNADTLNRMLAVFAIVSVLFALATLLLDVSSQWYWPGLLPIPVIALVVAAWLVFARTRTFTVSELLTRLGLAPSYADRGPASAPQHEAARPDTIGTGADGRAGRATPNE